MIFFKKFLIFFLSKWFELLMFALLLLVAITAYKKITDKQVEKLEKECTAQCEEICIAVCGHKK